MNFSFESIKNTLVQRLSLLSNWTINILTLGVYSRILDVISYGLEKMTYYLEYLYKNSFLKTAGDLAAVVVGSWRLGYQPRRKVGATGRVKISGDPSFSSAYLVYTAPTVEIPRWTVFEDENKTVSAYATSDYTYFTGTVIVNRFLTALDIPVNLGNGLVGFNVTSHQMPVGQIVTIQGTQFYDGDYLINAATTTNQVVVAFPGTYVVETFTGSEKIFTGHLYVNVSEGVPKQFTYQASGTVNETFTIFDDSADNTQVQEFIVDSSGNVLNTVTITFDIFLINSLTFYYCTVQSLPSFQGFTVQFGDGVTSKKLNAGQLVLTKYATTKGSTGDILQTGVLTQFKNPLIDTFGNTASVFVTNDGSIVGGADYEPIEHIRHFARNLFFAGYRAHSGVDWVAILDDNPIIAKSVVWTNFDVGSFNAGFTNSIVYISAVSTSGTALNPTQEAALATYLIPFQAVTDIIQIQPLQKINAQFRINAVLNPVPINPVIQNIYNSLVETYGILNTNYKTNIFNSSAVTLISQADPNILHHHTDLWNVERSEDYPVINDSLSAHTIIVSLLPAQDANPANQIFLKNLAVELWIRRTIGGVLQAPKRIGLADPLLPNTIIGDNGYTIVGSAINYATNQIAYNVQDIITNIVPPGDPDAGGPFGVFNPGPTDPLGYVLRLSYQTQDGNGNNNSDIRLPNFFNITDVVIEDVQYFFTFNY